MFTKFVVSTTRSKDYLKCNPNKAFVLQGNYICTYIHDDV